MMGVLRRHEALLFGHTEWMESWHPSRGAHRIFTKNGSQKLGIWGDIMVFFGMMMFVFWWVWMMI